jgi:hypothetical protein
MEEAGAQHSQSPAIAERPSDDVDHLGFNFRESLVNFAHPRGVILTQYNLRRGRQIASSQPRGACAGGRLWTGWDRTCIPYHAPEMPKR